MTLFQNITASSAPDDDDDALVLVDGHVRRVANSATKALMRQAPYVAANTGATYTATRTTLSEDFLLTVTANTTITLAGGNVSGEVAVWNIIFVQDSTGGRTISVNSVLWVGGSPTFTTAASASNHCSFVQHGTGTIWGYFGGVASAPAATTPPVAGYYDWWDATDGATLSLTGSRVDTWTSKGSQATVLTGNGNNVLSGTRTLNGLNVIDFAGSFFTKTSYGAAQPNTVFFVFARDTNVNAALMDGTGGGRNLLGFSGTHYEMYGGTGDLIGGTVDFNPHVRSAVFNGASSADYVDAASVNSGSVGTQSTVNLLIGAQATATAWDGYIAEIVVYTSALGTTDRQSVEAYLKAKWGTP